MEERLKKTKAELSLVADKAQSGLSSPEELESRRREALVQIGFLQHERLIHLIVTMTFAVLAMIVMLGLIFRFQFGLFILFLLLLVLLIPYVRHYYILENGVQELYTIYDKIYSSAKS